MGSEVSRCLSGTRCCTTPARHSVTQMCFNLAGNGQDGNTRRRAEWNNSTERGASCQRWRNTRELFCAPRAFLEVVAPSQLCPRVFSPGSTRTSSGCCCSVVSTSLCLQPRASADVAVHLSWPPLCSLRAGRSFGETWSFC